MYKKVELNDNEVLQNGIIIGQVIKKIDEGFVVRKGNFYQFCRNNNCGPHCKSSEKPSCRNNQKYSKRKGLYINI